MKKSGTQAKHWVSEPFSESGNTGGDSSDDSDRYDHFCTLLAEAGFSDMQRVLINDALRAAGLEIVANQSGDN